MTGFHDYSATRYETESGARVRVVETRRRHVFGEGYVPERTYDVFEKPEPDAIELWEELGDAIGIDRRDMLQLLSERDVDNGVCRCDDPEPGRTLAKGTPGERSFCDDCGGLIPVADVGNPGGSDAE